MAGFAREALLRPGRPDLFFLYMLLHNQLQCWSDSNSCSHNFLPPCFIRVWQPTAANFVCLSRATRNCIILELCVVRVSGCMASLRGPPPALLPRGGLLLPLCGLFVAAASQRHHCAGACRVAYIVPPFVLRRQFSGCPGHDHFAWHSIHIVGRERARGVWRGAMQCE